MKLRLNKYVGDSIVNSLRQAVMCRVPDTRPIAFKVGEMSDVVNISDVVEEDMTEFISNVSSSYYASANELEVFNSRVGNVLHTSDIAKGSGISVLSVGVSEVLHVLAGVPVTIYFRRDAGKFLSKENAMFLKSKGVDTNSLVIINSRHSPVLNFSFTKKRVSDFIDEFDISVYTNGSVPGEEILKYGIEILKKDLENINLGNTE